MCANDWQIIDVITSIDVLSTGEGIKFQSIDVISSECVKISRIVLKYGQNEREKNLTA